MDTEYVVSCMSELGELTSRDAVMALHHPDVYHALRHHVDNGLLIPPDFVQNLCDHAYNMESKDGQDYWNLQAIGDFNHSSRAIAERLACEISKRLVRDHKMATTSTNNVIFSVINSVNTVDNIGDIMIRPEQAIVQRYINQYNQIVSAHTSTFCTSTATNRVVVPASGSFGTITNCIFSVYGSMVDEVVRNHGHSKYKPSIQKRTKSAIKRALKLITGLGFGDEIKVFLSGTSIEVSHPESDFKFVMTKYQNSIIRSTEHPSHSTPFSLELYTKSDVFLSKLCVYLEDTPILDQVLALTMFVKSGSEDEILQTANYFSRTQDEAVIEEVLARNPKLTDKLAIKKGNSIIAIRNFIDPEYEERQQVSTAIMPRIQSIITSSGIPASVNLRYV